MKKMSFEDFVLDSLPQGARLEGKEALAPEKFAFWLQAGDVATRYNKKTTAVTEDGDAYWFAVRETLTRAVVDTRTKILGMTVMGATEEPDLHTPEKKPVKITSSSDAYMVVTQPNVDVMEAVSKRTTDATVRRLSDRAAIVKDALLIRLHSVDLDQAMRALPYKQLPLADTKDLYAKAIDTILGKNVVMNHELMGEEDARLVEELGEFLKTCVWATMEGDAIRASEAHAGPLKGALVVSPRTGPDEHTHLANRATNGLPYMRILNDDISFRWAALTFAKQASILKNYSDLDDKPETHRQFLESERKATQVEIALANVLSKGLLQKSAKAFARNLRESHADPGEFVRVVDEMFRKDCDRVTLSLDECIEPALPKTNAELSLRHGFHRALVLFTIADEVSTSAREANTLKEDMVEIMYRRMGQSIDAAPEAGPNVENN